MLLEKKTNIRSYHSKIQAIFFDKVEGNYLNLNFKVENLSQFSVWVPQDSKYTRQDSIKHTKRQKFSQRRASMMFWLSRFFYFFVVIPPSKANGQQTRRLNKWSWSRVIPASRKNKSALSFHHSKILISRWDGFPALNYTKNLTFLNDHPDCHCHDRSHNLIVFPFVLEYVFSFIVKIKQDDQDKILSG